MWNKGRAKPLVLVVGNQWCECNPAYGLSNVEHNIFGTLEQAALAVVQRFQFDVFYHRTTRTEDEANAAFLALCASEQPDLVLVDWLPGGGRHNLRHSSLEKVKQQGKAKIAVLWWDGVWPALYELSRQLCPFVDKHVMLDSTAAYLPGGVRCGPKYLPLWTPQDTRIYHSSNQLRDIPVSFIGSLHPRPDRVAGLAALRAAGIKVLQTGGQRETRLSLADYAGIYKKSQITLNFCKTGNNAHTQFKGRVIESLLCGALLLESDNKETSCWFTPMKEYVPFSTEQDLVEKVQYYLAHEEDRSRIAQAGEQKAQGLYSPLRFWTSLFAALWPGAFQ